MSNILYFGQDDFHRDLAVEMVGLRFAPPVSSAAGAIEDVLSSGGSLDEVARVAALDPRGQWTLCGIGIQGLLAAMTIPVSEG